MCECSGPFGWIGLRVNELVACSLPYPLMVMRYQILLLFYVYLGHSSAVSIKVHEKGGKD